MSVVSVETGKTIAKTSKALVRNGSCQWSDTLSESIRVSEDDSSKELEDCPFKLIVSMVYHYFPDFCNVFFVVTTFSYPT